MGKIKLKVRVSGEAYEILSAIMSLYQVSADEAIEMALTDFWLKNIGINIIPSDSIPEDEVRVIVVGSDS